MPEPRMPQQDRPRKTRSLGSFLLFLTILVAIVLVMGRQHLGRVTEYTQDQYYWELYKGEVEQQEFKGPNRIDGRLRNGVRFSVQFADVAQREEELRELAATQIQHEIEPVALLAGIGTGDYQVQLARLVIAPQEYQETVSTTGGEEVEPTTRRGLKERHKRLLVSVFARAESARAPDTDYYLPKESDLVWLRIKPLDDLPLLTAELEKRGGQVQTVSLAITDERGSSWQDTSSMLSTVLLVYGPWLLIFAVFLIFMRQMRNQGAAGGVMSFGRSRAQLYTKENHTNITFDDVAGAEEAKEEVREVVEFLKNPSRFTRIGGRIPRGILLVGSPGCGKTLLAKAIAGEAEVPFYSISGSDFVEMFVGVGASRVRDLFKQARENSPCIIFLDEIDAVGRRRGSGLGGGHDEREQTLNAILVEMDGFGTDEGIIVLAATNRPDVLDPALLRPGRFDREVTIDLPDVEGRRAILEVHLKKVKSGNDIDTDTLARSTPGYSGADLAATVNEAAIMAALQKSEVVLMEHLEEARDKVRYGRQKKSRKLEEADRKITARHEAGHAVVATVCDETDAPHKVTIVPRGRALGATMVLPEKESYHMQKRRLLGQLAVLFGGRASEELLCGDISAGASDDIRRATELARAMVTELGMSEKIGPINYAERQGSDFLGTELLAGKWHSEDTARKIDEEVKQLLDDAYARASKIVRERRADIERLSEALLEYETISGVEIRRIMSGVSVADLRPVENTPGPPAPTPIAPAPRGSEKPPTGKQIQGDIAGEPGLSPA